MSAETLCNHCKKSVKYINTRKEGSWKCNPVPVKAVQKSGRVVEVYLSHECEDRDISEVSPEKEAEQRFWTGPDQF